MFIKHSNYLFRLLFFNLLGPFSTTNMNRLIGVDYTWPIWDDHYKVVVPLKPHKDYATFLKVFNYEVWIGILICIPAVIMAMVMTDFMFSGFTNWEENIGFVTSVICNAYGSFRIPDKHIYHSTFVLTWTVAVFWFLMMYSGNLKAFLSQPKVERKIRTTEDLVNQDEIPWAIQEDDNFHIWSETLPPENPLKILADKAARLRLDAKWYGACFTQDTKQDNKYAAVCLGLDVRDLLSRDFSAAGKCNYYYTKETFLMAPIVLLYTVGKCVYKSNG